MMGTNRRFIRLVLAAVLITACNTARHSQQNSIVFAKNPVVAHRGAWKKNSLPENSIASLREAVRLQCTGTEFDIWMTADDSLVIHHDPEVNKMDIEKTGFEAVHLNRLSNNEPLPLLREYLQEGLRDNKTTRLVLEIKPSRISKERGEEVAEKVVQLVQALHASKQVVYISFDAGILQKIHALDTTAVTQYLAGDLSPAELAAAGIRGADYHYSVFKKNPGWIAAAKQLRLQLNAWTVNDAADMQWLLENGFDFITTNEPELLLGLLKRSGQ
ncbi:MAG: glycerophosphodiester phosphodiesterase family protein [Ferruginibacter sp.]